MEGSKSLLNISLSLAACSSPLPSLLSLTLMALDQLYLYCFIPLHVTKYHGGGGGRLGTGNIVMVMKLSVVHHAAARYM